MTVESFSFFYDDFDFLALSLSLSLYSVVSSLSSVVGSKSVSQFSPSPLISRAEGVVVIVFV